MKEKILADLIRINTINDKSNKEIREYIKLFLGTLNFEFEEIGDSSNKVLIAKRGNPKLGFVCHTDTVDIASGWIYEPMNLTKDNEYYYGLGVSDMKGGIAALLSSISEIPKTTSCAIYFTYDEEIGFNGIKELVASKKNLPDNLVFTEPTDLAPVIANKGCMEFKVVFKGKSTHSSTPMLGENAIYKALDYVRELSGFANSFTEKKDEFYDIPYTTFNLSKIMGGNSINSVPDNAEIYFDFRTTDKKIEKEILEYLDYLNAKFNTKMKIINNVPCAKTKSQKFIDIIQDICNMKCKGLNYVTEASFMVNKNILILGPGPVTAHESNEHISIESYDKTVETYKKIIEKFNN